EDILPQLARGRYLGMQLSKARHGLAIEHRPRRAAGMKILRDVCIEIQRAVLKARQQLLQVSLEMKDRDWLRLAVQSQRRQLASGGEGQAAAFIVTQAHFLEHFSSLEQSHIARSAIEVVTNHVEQAGCQRVAHVAR